MKRRDFLASVAASAALVCPFATRAQQATMPVIGFLHGQRADAFGHRLEYFHQGLNEAGFAEGRNITIEYRWANNQIELLPPLAADLVQRQVAVIVAPDGTASPLAAKSVTSKVPIIFVMGADPVKLGLVASLNRPGGNVTGVTTILQELAGKRIELLSLLTPASTIGLLIDPRSADPQQDQTLAAARAIGRQVVAIEARGDGDLEEAFATLVRRGAGALLINSGVLFTGNRDKIVALAARYRLPAIYPFREYAVDGGLMSYGGVDREAHRLSGLYAGQIVKGAKPAELPVQLPTKYELVINLKTAKELGVAIPPTLLAIADEVLE